MRGGQFPFVGPARDVDGDGIKDVLAAVYESDYLIVWGRTPFAPLTLSAPGDAAALLPAPS